MANENTTLEEMMGRKPRSISIDVTKGKPTEIPTNETATDQPAAEEPTPVSQATVVQSGHVDMSNMQPIDVNKILPKREEKPSKLENQLYADLDAAVNREMGSIETRIDAIIEAQEQEREQMAEKAIDKEIEKDLHGENTSDKDDEDEDLDPFDDKEDDAEEKPSVPSSDPTPEFRFGTAPSEDNEPANEEESTPKNDNIVIMDPVHKPSNDRVINILGNVDDDDLFKDDDDETADEDDEKLNKMLDNFKGEVKSRITPIKSKLDLSKFTIDQKPMSLQKVMKLTVKAHQNVADWILYGAERPISMIGLSGPEILKLNPENSNRNRLNTFKDMYRVIYDHVDDANKPEFEAWLKQTRFIDLQHIYFALYMATFGDSNFVNYSCPKCNKVFIQDIKLEDMVEYANDEVREKVRSILKGDTTTASNTYPVDLIQVSDSYVFGLRTPSVWNVIIETASLSERFLEKYADLIDIVSYIDSIYLIDEANKKLIPVDTKPDPDDMAKTAARRVKAFYDVLRTLSTDEFYALRGAITDYDKPTEDINYIIPASKCPECGAEIPANKDITPDSMLFTRHQLAAIGNM